MELSLVFCQRESITKGENFPLRRRLTPLGVAVFEGLSNVADTMKWVVASRHGDALRMERLFKSLLKQESLSPTDFSLSVHNAIYGLYSIMIKNKQMHTAVSAYEDTLFSGLVEAYALAKATKENVGFCYYDGPLPEIHQELNKTDQKNICLTCILGEALPYQNVYKVSYSKGQDLVSTEDFISHLMQYKDAHISNATMALYFKRQDAH